MIAYALFCKQGPFFKINRLYFLEPFWSYRKIDRKYRIPMGFPSDSVVKNLPPGDASLTPRSGRSPGGGYGNPLQYSCLENAMDKGPWLATVHGVAKSQIRLKGHSTHTCTEFLLPAHFPTHPIVCSIINILHYYRTFVTIDEPMPYIIVNGSP